MKMIVHAMSTTFHFNLVNHGHVQRAVDWPHSTFHRNVRDGVYAHEWSDSMENAVLGYD